MHVLFKELTWTPRMTLNDSKPRLVPHSKPREKNIIFREIYASGGGLLVAPHLLAYPISGYPFGNLELVMQRMPDKLGRPYHSILYNT